MSFGRRYKYNSRLDIRDEHTDSLRLDTRIDDSPIKTLKQLDQHNTLLTKVGATPRQSDARRFLSPAAHS
jgi:hypothetical protein